MTATQSNLAGLSRFIFRAPSWYASLAFAMLVAAMAGVAAFDTNGMPQTWRGLFFIGKDAWEGIFFIGVPTIVASVGTAGLDRLVGGKLTPNRSSLLALACEIIVVAVVTVAAIVSVLTPLDQRFVYDALVVALASIFALRLLVVMAVSRSSLPMAAIPASLQTVASAVLLFIYSGTLRFLEVGGPLLQAYLVPYLARPDHAPAALSAIRPGHFILLGITCAVYALAVAGFIVVIDRPWRQSLGVSPLDFLGGFIGHIAEGSRELEDFFEQLGQEAVVPVTVLAFRRRGVPDDQSGAGRTSADAGSEKARFVLPMIHPGPMGDIGGGNLPERVARSAEGLAFPPHATAGHDFNLVTAREIDPVLEAAEAAHERITYSPEATESVRVESGEAKLLGQAFGGDALLVTTYSPGCADDVEYAVGLSAAAEARTTGIDDVLLVDAHNCNDGLDGPDLGHVTPGSRRSFDMIRGARRAGEELGEAERGDLSLGVAWDRTPWEPAEGIGPLGVRVAVSEVNGETTAYVLVDGNNMEPGLRDELVADLTGGEEPSVDVAEIMTTDTHVVNTVEADNQVGAVIDRGEFRGLVEGLVGEALRDREPVTAGMAVEHAEVTVFGNDRTESLASHANVAISMGGALAASVIITVMTVSVLIFLFA